jgi:transmembrane sensor
MRTMTEFNGSNQVERLNQVKPEVIGLPNDGFDPIEREAYEWIARFAAGQMTSADVEAMKAWYRQSPAHAAAYAEVRRVWQAVGPAASAVTRQDVATPRIQGAVTEGRSVTSRRAAIRVAAGGFAAAAAGYLVFRPPLGLWPSYSEFIADYRTEKGEQRRVTLADTVSLDLNTGTAISIQSQAADAARIALVSGELAVSTGAMPSSLTVVAADGRIVTAKANFNLRCDGNNVGVSCLEGDLKVEQAGLSLALTAGQQVRYGPDGIGAVKVIDPERVTAWQHGTLIFDAMPVTQVVEEVNRYRSGRIVLMNSEIGSHLLTARLRIAEADKIISQIVHIFGAKARALPGGIVILT